MSNGHIPRHTTANGAPLWRRAWRSRAARVAAAVAVAFGLGWTTEHVIHLVWQPHGSHASEEHSHQSHTEVETVVETKVPPECADALAAADEGLALGGGHIKDMIGHIEETGAVGRGHNADMRELSDELDDLRHQFDDAKADCTGGESGHDHGGDS